MARDPKSKPAAQGGEASDAGDARPEGDARPAVDVRPAVDGRSAGDEHLGGQKTAAVEDDGSQEFEARARRLMRRRARLARGTAPWQAEAPPSPCIKVCRFEPDGRWCEGCFRTASEIRDWPILSPDDKAKVLERLAPRRLEPKAHDPQATVAPQSSDPQGEAE